MTATVDLEHLSLFPKLSVPVVLIVFRIVRID